MTRDALTELYKANAVPYLFSRGGELVRVRKDEVGKTLIDAVDENILRGRMDTCANFYTAKENDSGTIFTPCSPPLDVARNVIALGEWQFPRLVGVIECPALRPDGTVIMTPGYDAVTALFYQPAPGLVLGDVPCVPTAPDVQSATSLIWEAIGDFPYIDAFSQANALAALLTPFLRPAINGRVPLALMDAPQAGTGKSLLVETIGRICVGRAPDMMT